MHEANVGCIIGSMGTPRRSPASAPDESTRLEDAVENLTGEVRTLSEQVEILRIAIDDLRSELEFAIRNLPREPWVPTQPLVSMPKNPLAPEFPINRRRREDVPAATKQPPAEAEALPSLPQAVSEPPATSRRKQRKVKELF